MRCGFYKHESSIDLVALVLKIVYRGPSYLKAKVEWWIRGESLGIKQNITIMNVDEKRWKPFVGW